MSQMIPLHIADQAVANCEAEITRLRSQLMLLTCKGAGMAGYLNALTDDAELIYDGGELQRILRKAVSDWDTAVNNCQLKP